MCEFSHSIIQLCTFPPTVRVKVKWASIALGTVYAHGPIFGVHGNKQSGQSEEKRLKFYKLLCGIRFFFFYFFFAHYKHHGSKDRFK